jgi:hypothetical protein
MVKEGKKNTKEGCEGRKEGKGKEGERMREYLYQVKEGKEGGKEEGT